MQLLAVKSPFAAKVGDKPICASIVIPASARTSPELEKTTCSEYAATISNYAAAKGWKTRELIYGNGILDVWFCAPCRPRNVRRRSVRCKKLVIELIFRATTPKKTKNRR